MKKTATLAIIGGSGLNALELLGNSTLWETSTPWGTPSCPVVLGSWHGQSVAFLARHGRPHHIPPHRINYRANLWALRQLGVQAVVAVNVVGGIHVSMRQPGQLVVPDQIIDYTSDREHTFFDGSGGEAVKHIDFTFPYDESIRQGLLAAVKASSFHCLSQGTYGCTQGPRLETVAEVARMQKEGCDLVGMTGMPEAALAREIDLPYASLCLVVNPAAGLGQGVISISDIEMHMHQGMKKIKSILGRWVQEYGL